ncbi:synaptic vesicle glycoprotein 2B-like isoform X2 [Chrysoperla carnea]|uniref:synaptic vesicle glycoprotein 2B-like isoform X2 n=1 Tax=Chrysoperla carnea TaxID=189513 RepID=UPI001D093F11|nr:synaptic vesicle glycoprotein 2B-like isoform X2 [Chrysoperla carnea]
MGLDFVDGQNADFERALEAAGFGRFHYLLLTICGLIYLNTAVGITAISFVLPAAQCDLQMNSGDKGLLIAAPMLGMVIGSYFWGCLADTKGRKTVLIGALLLDGVCGLASSICQFFWLFMFFRFWNGFGITGAMGICFPYLGEFQPTKYRETILCWMELFWTVGIILLPLIAWAIIPLEFRYEDPNFTFASWNLFVAICALPSLAIGFWLFAFPESPKFLLECGESEAALDILKDIYVMNTNEPRGTYPVRSLREKARALSVISQQSAKSVRSLSIRKPKELRMLLQEIWIQTKALCRPPHLKWTIITCTIQFGLTTSYYTLMIWFPELFYRFEEYEKLHPGETASVCEVSQVVVTNSTTEDVYCDNEPIKNDVFLHTLIIGLACIPTSFWLPLCVHRLGTKFFLVFSLLVAAAVTLGLYFVKSAAQNLILSCIFEALTSLGISTVYCILVDLFPTNLRVMAAALSLTWGRGGALLGNLLFGYLIDLNCVIPIVLFSFLLFVSGLLCFTLPNTGNQALD